MQLVTKHDFFHWITFFCVNWQLWYFKMFSDSKVGLIRASGGVSRRRHRLRHWLQAHLDSQDIPGVCWLDKECTMFRIPWTYVGPPYCSPDSGRIFMASHFFIPRCSLSANISLNCIGLRPFYMFSNVPDFIKVEWSICQNVQYFIWSKNSVFSFTAVRYSLHKCTHSLIVHSSVQLAFVSLLTLSTFPVRPKPLK